MFYGSPPKCKPVLAFLYINVRILHFWLPQLLPQTSQSDLVYALEREMGGLGLKQTKNNYASALQGVGSKLSGSAEAFKTLGNFT